MVQGQIVAEVDPITYRDKVNISRAQRSGPGRSWPASVPTCCESARKVIQIEIARRTFAAASACSGRAEESLSTIEDVEKGVDEARAQVTAAKASLTLAELEFTLHQPRADGGQYAAAEAIEVTQSRDSAGQLDAADAKLAKAIASPQIDVARRTLEAAEVGTSQGH